MRKLEETCAFEQVCSGCKHLKSKSKKNAFGGWTWTWYCTTNHSPDDIMGCRGFSYRD